MFRVTQFMRELIEPSPVRARRDPPGPVVIWNLTRRCNLSCKHCYSLSQDREYPGELGRDQIFATLDDLRSFGVPVIILSGGEPLLHPYIWDISERARSMGFYVALSTNGTCIDAAAADRIAAMGYGYVGISLDGIGDVHDAFRRKRGAFHASLSAIRLCVARGVKVGIRFTLTQDNEASFADLLDLMPREGIEKFYLSHLNYGGRGNLNRADDAYFETTRRALDRLFAVAWDDAVAGVQREYVTGNNDADGVYLYHWARARFPERAEHLRAKLVEWGGNASGVNVANIDNLGDVHPDTYWGDYTLGNVTQRPFSQIWQDLRDPLIAGMRQRPRPVKGRCARCHFIDVCNGNTRTRAWQLTGDAWAEDPGCYLHDHEIGVVGEPRVPRRPFRPQGDAQAQRFIAHLKQRG